MTNVQLIEKLGHLIPLVIRLEDEMGEFVNEDTEEKQIEGCLRLFEKTGSIVIEEFVDLVEESFVLKKKYDHVGHLCWEIITETGCSSFPYDHGIDPLLDGIDSFMDSKWSTFFEKHKEKFPSLSSN